MANTMDHLTDRTAKAEHDEPAVSARMKDGPPPGLGGRSAESFARDLLDALIRFRDGDFSSRMPTDVVGIDGKIADVFNDILAVSARRAA